MATAPSKLIARVIRDDTKQGPHGIRVEALDAEKSSGQPIGVSLTNRNELYSSTFAAKTTAGSIADATVRKMLRDREAARRGHDVLGLLCGTEDVYCGFTWRHE